MVDKRVSYSGLFKVPLESQRVSVRTHRKVSRKILENNFCVPTFFRRVCVTLILLLLMIISPFVSGMLFVYGRFTEYDRELYYLVSAIFLLFTLFLSVCLVESLFIDVLEYVRA
jgi:hypothetical protein